MSVKICLNMFLYVYNRIGFLNLFNRVQRKKKLEHPLAAYLIKPVQRITKYQLLLKDLQACCAEGQGEIKVTSCDFLCAILAVLNKYCVPFRILHDV